MKQTIHIKGFHAGLWGGVDERDVPLDGFAYSENVNPAQVQGKLSGIDATRRRLFRRQGLQRERVQR